ncbi:hypothetical protein NBRC116592_15260 [Colwellia sp. KU-HH00111]|uniref:hypothetical protein n=1 Tax=Colwellia sp. KU-HH00111 TaxID=3127652 RepID=UPI0031039D6B
MKLKSILITSTLLGAMSSVSHAESIVSDDLYKEWCLTGMSQELDGEVIPDKSNYNFTRDNKLKYQAAFFKQEGDFSIEGNKIKTKGMGNYKIVSIKPEKMVLYYGGYMHFKSGVCN